MSKLFFFAIVSIMTVGMVAAEHISETQAKVNHEVFEMQTISVSSKAESVQALPLETYSESDQKEVSYTDDDLFCLAAVVYREAGAESEEAQLLVANVVMNRVDSPLYPNTIHDVLTQKKQYGTMWKNGVSFPDNANEETVERCYAIAKRILDGERVCPESVLFQAEFLQGTGLYKEVDGIYFCYYE